MTINTESVKTLAIGSTSDCIPILSDFNTQFEKQTNFPQVEEDLKTNLWTVIFTRIQSPSTPPEFIRVLLSTLRILSREKLTLESIMTEERAKIMLEVAKLKESANYENNSDRETLEGLKVVYNMLFQSCSVRKVFVDNELLQGLVTKIKHFRSSESASSLDVKFFTLRILFIITALSKDTVAKVRYDLKGVIYIVEFLESLSQGKQSYDDMTVDIICDTLKVLYNLFNESPLKQNSSDANNSSNDDDELGHLLKTTQLVRTFLLHDTKSSAKREDLQNHSINLLTVIPNACFEELIPETNIETPNSSDGKDLSAIESILDFLKQRIFLSDGNRTLSELLSPVLITMIRISGSNMIIRKYLKLQVLPPLKKQDVVEKPEVGNTLRNKLCALLTSPAGNIAELVANFLFILCNENVKKLIKYTGYGNAAGLLANKGLLLGGRVTEYCSSDSDNSDTEEYKEVRHLVNEVEGWIQPERPHGCEGMTDEQKEYEAMKLVEAIEMLNRSNVITPCRIGEDGRPQPLNHVLQLQEEVVSSFNSETGANDSDND